MSGTAEPYLASPSATLEILQRYGLHTQKKYGQNFLIDAHIPEKIREAAQIGESDNVIEIGPGIGTLTQFLAQKAGHVTAVEIDTHLIPVLEETLSEYEGVRILQGDILKLKPEELLSDGQGEGELKVVANLPYYITTPVLMWLLESDLPLSSCTVMVQKEVADRIQASPGSRDYGALSLAVQYYTEPREVLQVPPSCFLPKPNVGSSVVHMKLRNREERLPREEESRLFRVIRAAFSQRRKTLYNALRNREGALWTKEEIARSIAACGFREDIRGEALSLEDFIRLSGELG